MSAPAAPPARMRRPLANLRGGLNSTRRLPPRPGLRQTTPSAAATTSAPGGRRCPQCDSTDIQEDDGFIVCQSCFTQIGEANIVADVTFEEQAGGRSTVQGGFVSDNARHAKTLGAGAYRKVGGGERNSLAEIESAGRRALGALTPKLGIADTVSQQANQIWTLAANINFSAGRKTDEVVAACLYAACRRQTENEILLMDIAELLQINVFRLGEVYKDLCKELYLANESVGIQHLVELEPLIWKYCRKLQFEDKTKDVATDALKIMKRMTRDWIVAGRHPAGLCGASIILAARMNNFRRSVREVVYVSKVADVTIAKRVEEFRRTKSAALTIDQFREFGNRLKHQHDPPSMDSAYYRDQILERRKQKRREHMLRQSATPTGSVPPANGTPDSTQSPARVVSPLSSNSPVTSGRGGEASTAQTAVAPPTPPATQTSTSSNDSSIPAATMSSSNSSGTGKRSVRDDESESTDPHTLYTPQALATNASGSKRQKISNGTSNAATTTNANATTTTTRATPSGQEIRYDADGFAVPPLPVDPAITDTPSSTGGRRKKNDTPPMIDLSAEELMEEEMLEQEIESALGDEEVIDSRNEVEKAKDEERSHLLAVQQMELEAQRVQARRLAQGVQFGAAPAWSPGDVLDEMDLEKEFENDPEVQNCQLSPEEVQVKERIWVAHNEDWLRKQAEKEMMQNIARATNPQSRTGRRGKKGDKAKKRRGKMGDGSVLTEHSTPIETPADAAKAMLEKRAPQKSMHVDFGALERIYGREPSRASSESASGSVAESREQTPAPTVASGAGNEPTVPSADNVADDEDDAAVAGAENEEEADEANDEDEAASVASDFRPTTWDDVGDDDQGQNQDDDEEAEDDYRRAIGVGATEEDEFGAVDTGYDGDDYDEYE